VQEERERKKSSINTVRFAHAFVLLSHKLSEVKRGKETEIPSSLTAPDDELNGDETRFALYYDNKNKERVKKTYRDSFRGILL